MPGGSRGYGEVVSLRLNCLPKQGVGSSELRLTNWSVLLYSRAALPKVRSYASNFFLASFLYSHRICERAPEHALVLMMMISCLLRVVDVLSDLATTVSPPTHWSNLNAA